MKKIRKFFKFSITLASIVSLLASFGNISKGEDMFMSFLVAVISMLVLYAQAASSGMLHKSFYESEE